MGGFANFGGYDDGLTGDGIGSGFSDSTSGYSGIDQGLLDAVDVGPVDPGAPVQADYTSGLTDAGVFDLFGGVDTTTSVNLAGNSETPPAFDGSLGVSENGSGSAPPAHGTTSVISASGLNAAFNALGKFGVSFASMFSGNRVAAGPGGVPVGAPGSRLLANGAIYRTAPQGISRGHASAVLVIAALLIGGMLFTHGG